MLAAVCACQASSESGGSLPRAAIAHGELQLERMLRDRPGMRLHVRKGDVIWTWAVTGFAGTDEGGRVLWDPASPSPGVHAEHQVAIRSWPASIRVRDVRIGSKEYAFELMWSSFVFEVLNLETSAEYVQLDKDARLGKVSKSEWMRRTTFLEFKADMKTRAFYTSTWKPWADQVGHLALPMLWCVTGTTNYCEWIETRKGSDWWNFLEAGFERVYARYRRE